MSSFVNVCVLALVLLICHQADAQDLSPDEQARAVFDAAELAYSEGRYEEALDRFQEAFALSGRPELLFNVGTAAQRLRRDAVAIDAFERYLESQPDAFNRSDVESRLVILREAEAPASRRTPLAWTFAGTTLAFSGFAIAAWVVAGNRLEELEASCQVAGCPEEDIESSSVRTWDRMTSASIGLAAASAIASSVLFFVEGRGERNVSVGLGPGQLSLRGSF